MNSTNGLVTPGMASDSYLKTAPSAEVVCDSRCRCGLAASNTDKKTLKIPQSYVGWDSTVDSVTGEVEIAGAAAIECCCIEIVQLMLVLK